MPRDEKALPNAERARIRPVPIVAIYSPVKPTECVIWAVVCKKKMLINDVGSRYVYENKPNMDKMPGEMSDIFGNLTRVLQNFPALEAQFAGICVFGTGFDGDEQTQNFPIQISARFH